MTEENQQREITAEDLQKLTDEQLQYVAFLSMRRPNKVVVDIVNKVMEKEATQIIAGLAKFPPVYISPEIELNVGLKVVFRSLLSLQTDDVTEATATWSRAKQASEQATGQRMAQLFLCHGIESINGQPFGGRQITPEFVQSILVEPAEFLDALVEMRNTRMKHLSILPDALVTLLIAANTAFQGFYDSVVNMRGTPSEIEQKVKKIGETVGKSTGPLQAGQKQT